MILFEISRAHMVQFHRISLILPFKFMLKIGKKKCDFCVMRQICLTFINNKRILDYVSAPILTYVVFSRGHATLHLAVSVRPSVRRSVRNIFELRAVFALLLLPNRPRLDCRVSGLVDEKVKMK